MEICFKLCQWYYSLCLYEKVTSAHACKHYDKIKILFVCCVVFCLFNRNAHYWYIRLSFQRKCSIMMPKVNNSLSEFQNKTSGSSLFKSHYESTKPIRSLRGYYCNLYEPPYLSVFAFMALLCYKKKVHWVGLRQKLLTSDTLMRDLLIEPLFVWSLCFSHALVLPTWSPNLLVA